MARSEKSATSPVGSAASEASQGRSKRSTAYRAEQKRLAPYEELARIVIAHRMRLGITQKELANRMKTSHSAISRIESGQYATKPETLRRLAGAFGLRFVMGFEDESGPEASRQLIAM